MAVAPRTHRRRPVRRSVAAVRPGRGVISVKSADDIAGMRAACDVVVATHRLMRRLIAPGITTAELEREADRLITAAGGRAAFLGNGGYPARICTSVNDEVIHGIPGPRRLAEGDIISVDIGVELDGYFGDAAWTYPVGTISDAARHLLAETKGALDAGGTAAVDGAMLRAIGDAIAEHARRAGLGILEDYGGHGVGRALWEEPFVPNQGQRADPIRLRAGMALAIEPMLTLGEGAYRVDDDGWTVRTRDGSLAAHFEHTIVVSESGPPDVLTAGLSAMVD